MQTHLTWFEAVKQIPGWFYREDAILFGGIHAIQTGSFINGDLLEIGVYHGRSAAFMGFLRRPGERFVVCDLFSRPAVSIENQTEKDDWYSDLTQEAFERTYRRFHENLPEILACPSNRMTRSSCLSPSFRLIHIDGSHVYRLVRGDIRTACRLVRPGGVIAIDDYRSVHTPGVAAATWEAVMEGRLTPIGITPQKMYATVGDRRVPWLKKLMIWGKAQQELRIAVDVVRSRRVLRFSIR